MTHHEKTCTPTIGQNYYVRTLSDHWVGRLVAIGPHCFLLEDAAWIADTGRYLTNFMESGKAEGMEIEIVGTICVQWHAWLPWRHELFKERI